MHRVDRLELKGLCIRAAGPAGTRDLVRDVSLSVEAGQVVALVGASGSGKTMTARACLGMVPVRPGVVAGSLRVTVGEEVHEPYAAADREAAFRAIRGRLVGWLPQDAVGSLDPLWTVRAQVAEVLRLCKPGLQPTERDVLGWLARAGFERPEAVVALYAHELSGGMAQRVGIALALARGSRFLLADEPTTGLDPTIQEAILAEMTELAQEGLGILLITHDLRLVPRVADRVVVMHEGVLVDDLPADRLHAATSAPARRLFEATARISGGRL